MSQNYWSTADFWKEWQRRQRAMAAPATPQQQPQTAYTGQPTGDPFRVQGFSFGAPSASPDTMFAKQGDLAEATDTTPPAPAHETMSAPVPQPTAVGNPPVASGVNLGDPVWGQIAGIGGTGYRIGGHLNWKPADGPLQAGTDIGWGIGVTLPVAYDPGKDVPRHALASRSNVESDAARVHRYMVDTLRANPGLSAQEAFNWALRALASQDQPGLSAFDLHGVKPLAQGERPVAGQNTGLDGGAYHGPVAPGGPAAPAAPGGPGGPGTAPSPAAPGGPVDPSALRGAYLMQNKDAAFQVMMQAMGLDPNAPSIYGNFLEQTLTPLLQRRMQLEGFGDPNVNASDRAERVAQDFGRMMQGPGAFGQVQQFANQALQQAPGVLNNLKDQSQAQNILAQILNLRYAGSNPIVAQAYGDQFQRAMGGFESYSYQNLGRANSDPLMQWLASSPWASIIAGR